MSELLHFCIPNWAGTGNVSAKRKKYFVKEEFTNIHFASFDNRSELVRFFMEYFKDRNYSNHEIGTITHFLKRAKLTRAERHAVIFHLGFRYSAISPLSQFNMANLQIDGYFSSKKKRGVISLCILNLEP